MTIFKCFINKFNRGTIINTHPHSQYAFADRYMADGETITVYYLPNQLVGQYFEVVE